MALRAADPIPFLGRRILRLPLSSTFRTLSIAAIRRFMWSLSALRLARASRNVLSTSIGILSPYPVPHIWRLKALSPFSQLAPPLSDLSTNRVAARYHTDLSLSRPIADSQHSPFIDLGSQ